MEALREPVCCFAGLGPALRPPRHRRDCVAPAPHLRQRGQIADHTENK